MRYIRTQLSKPSSSSFNRRSRRKIVSRTTVWIGRIALKCGTSASTHAAWRSGAITVR